MKSVFLNLKELWLITVIIGFLSLEIEIGGATIVLNFARAGDVDEQLLESYKAEEKAASNRAAGSDQSNGASKKTTQAIGPAVKAAKNRAKAAWEKRDYKQVLILLKPFVDPPDKEVLRLLAHAAEKENDHGERVRFLEVLTRTWPSSLEDRLALGSALRDSGKFDAAIEQFRFVLQSKPQSKQAYEGLLGVFERQKNRYEAQAVLSDMAKRFGRDPDVFKHSCRLQYVEGLFAEALKSCSRAIELDFKTAENHVYLGLVHLARDNSKQAEKILFATAKRFPKSQLAADAAGELAEKQKLYEKAKSIYSSCLKSNAESQSCWMGLSRVSFELRDYQSANDGYKTICKWDQTIRGEIFKRASLARLAGSQEWSQKLRTTAERCGQR